MTRLTVVSRALGLASLMAVSAAAEAQEPDLGLAVTDTLTAEWRADNQNGESDDDDYGAVLNRVDLGATAGGLSAQAQVDSFTFIDPPTGDFRDNLLLERFTAQVRTGDWHLLVGDFRLQLGRGIVASFRKEADVGLDNAVTGGQIELAPEDHRLTLFAGLTNPSNIDTVTQHEVAPVDDTIVGAAYRFTGLEAAKFDLFGMYLEPSETLLDDRDYTVSGGLSVELPSVGDWMSLYLEGDAQERRLAGTSEQGYAAYLTGDLFFGNTALLVEGLLLDAFEQLGSRNTALGTRFQYNRPPTLERIEEEILNNRDVVGGRLRVEQYVRSIDLTVFANGTYRLESPGEAEIEVRQLHGYGGLEVYFQDGSSRLSASGGYRDDHQQGARIKSIAHAEVDYLQSVTGPHSLHLSSTTEIRTLLDADYSRGSVFASYEWASMGSLTFELGFDTQDPSPEVANWFYAGVLAWRSVDWLDLALTAGTQRGGIKCISGVCRDFPEFAGARLEAAARF